MNAAIAKRARLVASVLCGYLNSNNRMLQKKTKQLVLEKHRLQACARCTMDDAVVLPIFYDKDYRLVQPNVKNFFQNAMEYRNLRDVYFVPE